MKEKIAAYKKKLEQGIAEYMAAPMSERSASAVRGMAECWEVIDRMERCVCAGGRMTREDAEKWVGRMVNSDGTTGGHWTMEQTSAVAESMGVTFERISPWSWWAAMNMMYSDYYSVGAWYKVDVPDFYACLAKAFLLDEDAAGPEEKLAAYYRYIASE